jgi:hypothetical protein
MKYKLENFDLIFDAMLKIKSNWGSEKLFLGVLTKNKIFTQLSFLEFYADSEF